jgi:Antibiotic biosynthesis monooxygenase
MFARIATFEGVDADAADRTLDEVRERVEPIMRGMTGFQGYMELMDRASSKAMTVSFFDSEENMRAAEPTFDEEMPRQLGDLMEQWAGRRSAVERYEVLLDRRSGA